MERGTGTICRRADMATRGHVTGYGQSVLKERAAALSEFSPVPARRGVIAPRQLTMRGQTRNVFPSRLGQVAIILNKYRFGQNRAQRKPSEDDVGNQ